jgi:hypothetical protein
MPGQYSDAKNMAMIIVDIYKESFGGKSRGRYQLSRAQFRKLAKRKRLSDSFINEVSEECLESGYILIPVGDSIAVIEEEIVSNYRIAPKRIINNFVTEKDDDDEEKEDDDDDDNEDE